MPVGEPTRVLVCGAGRFGTLHARVWQEAGAQVVGLVDTQAQRARDVAARYAIPDTDTDSHAAARRLRPDVVVIATDEATHADLAVDALEAGAHVFVEKPFALNSADAARMITTARTASREIIAGHISRFAQPYSALSGALTDGRVGQLWSMRLRRDFSRSWFEDFGSRVDPVWESCIHDIDLALSFTGCPARRVYAARSGVTGEGSASVVTAVIDFADGVMATIETAWTIPAGAPQTESGALELPGTIVAEAELHGSRGVARQRLLNDGLTVWNDTESWAPNPFLWPLTDGHVGGALRAEVEYAISVVRGERTNDQMPMQQAAWGISIAEAVTESISTGAAVAIGDAGAGP